LSGELRLSEDNLLFRWQPTAWIISPVADAALLVASPMLIVPAIALAAKRFSPEAIFLAVAAFASIGHHLPGFLRAYGDRELFRRFRWRFLLAPPLILGVALTAAREQLHGLELVLLVWATWHVMMQTYGLMRIYDLKRGVRDRLSARFDFAACTAVFLAGVLFSQTRLFMILEAMERVRLPLVGAVAPSLVRSVVAAGILGLLGAYAVHAVFHARKHGPSWIKLGLLIATGWLYWACGSIGTNLLIGVAMFEIFHALQYYAIAWSYNRRLNRRDSARLGPTRFLFADGWLPLAMYCGAIAAFGSIKLFSSGLEPSLVKTWLVTLLLTSTALHFYFDGFIWKVSESGTRQNLGIEGGSPRMTSMPGLVHAGKWCGMALLVAALFCCERWGPPPSAPEQGAWLAAAAVWTPDAPEMLLRKCYFCLGQGNGSVALSAATRLAHVRPGSAEVELLLARSDVAIRDFPAADAAARQAVDLDPDSADANFQLGLVNVQLGHFDVAQRALERALRASPNSAAAHMQLGNVFFLTGRVEQAEQSYRRSAALNPKSAECQGNLGAALLSRGRIAEAKAAFEAALAISDNPQCNYNLALILLSDGQAGKARSHLVQAEKAGQPIPLEIRRAAGM
jgi:tetratricopeptide (TPR) repeat protein